MSKHDSSDFTPQLGKPRGRGRKSPRTTRVLILRSVAELFAKYSVQCFKPPKDVPTFNWLPFFHHRFQALFENAKSHPSGVVAETLALHVRQFMMIVPPVRKIDQPAVRKLGSERYEVFVKEIAKRIASDSGIVADIMELIAKSHGDRSTQPMGNDAMPPATAQPLEAAAHA